MNLKEFEESLEKVNLGAYREKYKPIKIVEMDLPKEIQALDLLYDIYWGQRQFRDYDDFSLLSKLSFEVEP